MHSNKLLLGPAGRAGGGGGGKLLIMYLKRKIYKLVEYSILFGKEEYHHVMLSDKIPTKLLSPATLKNDKCCALRHFMNIRMLSNLFQSLYELQIHASS